MKIKRYKKVSKNLNFYVNSFKFRQPYQVLIDGTFCFGALNNKINIADNIPRYLQAELKFLTTPCISLETENLGRKTSKASYILKQFALHKCGHEKKPVAGADCLLSMVGQRNENHYFIATQDLDLQNKLRQIPGVPLLYLHQKTPVLEQPSVASLRYARNISCLGETERENIAELKEKHGLIDVDDDKPKKKKKRKAGPNPLSCKKKAKKPGVTQNNNIRKKEGNAAAEEKKRRKKLRIPKHVKEELVNSINK